MFRDLQRQAGALAVLRGSVHAIIKMLEKGEPVNVIKSLRFGLELAEAQEAGRPFEEEK
jgi:hypothetical protein